MKNCIAFRLEALCWRSLLELVVDMQIVWQVSRWSNDDGVKMWEDYPTGVQRALERRLATRGPDSTGMYVYIGRQDRYGNEIRYWVDFTNMTEWSRDGLRRFEVRRIEILNAPP